MSEFKELIDIKKEHVSESFCVLPWMHLNVQPNGEVFQCCMAPHDRPVGDVTKNTLPEIWNNHSMKDIRRKMVKGIKPKLCQRCFMMEDNGVASPRNTFNEFFAKDITNLTRHTEESGHNNKFILKYWDFRWSNICNFKCRMCGTFASSKWEEDEKALHGQTYGGLNNFRSEAKEDVFKYVDQFMGDVEEVYFAGGEPLMMDEHYIILEKLIAAGRTDVRLRYNTNFSHIKFKKWDLQELWKPFLENPKGNIQLFASLDAVGKLAEVARHGTKWNVVLNNVRECINRGMEIHLGPTLSLLNIHHLTGLLDVCFELGIPEDRITMNNFLTSPGCYDIRILPEHLKEEVLQDLTDYIQKFEGNEYRKGFLNFVHGAWTSFIYSDFPGDLKAIQIARLEFLRATTILDKRRKEDFLEVNPQYKEWFDELRAIVGNYHDVETFYDERQ